MRVLMISLDRGLFGSGSSGDVIVRHQKYADLCGQLDIIVFAPKELSDQEVAPNFHVYSTASVKRDHYRAAFKKASELLAQNKYDLLVTQEFAAPVGAQLKNKYGLPWLVSIHSMFFSRQWLGVNLLNWYLFWKIRKAIRSADAFRVTNNLIKKYLEKIGCLSPVLVLPTPVDTSRFFIGEKNSQLPLLLFVGRLSAEKNIPLLIRAVKAIDRPFRLMIVGEGPELGALQKLAAMDRRIEWAGPKNHEALYEIYAKADIFILPSNSESFGKVLIEAAASGCALVATRTAGAQSIITDEENGLLFDVNNEAQLRLILERLLAEPQYRHRFAEAAIRLARKFDGPKATDELMAFWKKIAEAEK